MPRYFFNLHKVQPAIDELGDELPDDNAAWKEATKIAGELLRSLDGTFQPGQQWAVEVADVRHQSLFWIRISAEQVHRATGLPRS
jgi:uncharacterized protein DUF6894